MRKRGDPCACVARFLNCFSALRYDEMRGVRYVDEVCEVVFDGHAIRARAYEVAGDSRHRIDECVVSVW